MHTVPEGYFKAFTFPDHDRRDGEAIMRFDRQEPGQGKWVSLSVSEVVRDIYTVFDDTGRADTGIEDILCKWEGEFCAALRPVVSWNAGTAGIPIDKDQWVAISRFIAAQLLRTPAIVERMKNYLTANQMPHGRDSPPRVMLFLIKKWMLRLARMKGSLIYTLGDLPLLTSDNPVALWDRRDFSMTPGTVDQFHPHLAVSCPLTPRLLYLAEQTSDSLAAVLEERHHKSTMIMFATNLLLGTIPEVDVKKLNGLCVANAYRRVYANYCDQTLLRFLKNRFWFSN